MVSSRGLGDVYKRQEGVLDADDADLFAVRADQADFRNADTLVDAGIADGGTPLCETTGDPAPTGGALGNEEGLPCADADGGLDTIPSDGTLGAGCAPRRGGPDRRPGNSARGEPDILLTRVGERPPLCCSWPEHARPGVTG